MMKAAIVDIVVASLYLVMSAVTVDAKAEHGVYRPMLRGDLNRFVVDATNRVDYSDRIGKLLPPKKKITTKPNEEEVVVDPLYHDVDFTQQDVTPWLRDYIHWHHQIRTVDPELMKTSKFLLVEPQEREDQFEHNFKHLPYYLWLAAKHGRILLLRNWEISSLLSSMCGIQEYLRPNLIDWTVPTMQEEDELDWDAAVEIMSDSEHHFYNTLIENAAMNQHKDSQMVVVRGSQLSYQIGLDRVWIDSQQNNKIFYYIFQSLFRLAEPVQELVDNTKTELGLVTNEYVGLYVRLPGVYGQLYDSYKKGPFLEDPKAYDNIQAKMMEIGTKALERTKQFVVSDTTSTMPVYVAGDTVESMDLWTTQQQQEGNNNNEQQTIVYNQDAILFAHDNNNEDNDDGDCTRFYPAVVDLWILSEAKCIGFGNHDDGAVAALMNGMGCWTLYERNAVISSMGPQSPFSYLPKVTMDKLLSFAGPTAAARNSLLKTS